MTELGESVANGKKLLATSISSYITTASDATWSTIKTNMESAFTNRYNAGVSATKKGTATADQVLSGYTFTNASGVGLSGIMPYCGAWTSTSSGSGNITIPAGYHNGSGYVDCSGAYNAGVAAGRNGYIKVKTVSKSVTLTGGGDSVQSNTINFGATVLGIAQISNITSTSGSTFVNIKTWTRSGTTITLGIRGNVSVTCSIVAYCEA